MKKEGRSLFENVEPDHEDFLRDESRRVGNADTISFPHNEDEVREILGEAEGHGLPVTTQGGRTGITAGAVPGGGHVLNLTRMSRITGLRNDAGKFYISVQPGVLLADLREAIHHKKFDTTDWSAESLSALKLFKDSGEWFFPPDPTETTASIGGMISCNASGALTFHYGPTRQYVQSLKVLLADGTGLNLRRGEHKAAGRSFVLVCEDGWKVEGELPSYRMPAIKNAAGYYAADNMDLIDLIIGSEGTLGITVEVELLLLPTPPVRWGVMAFLPDEDRAVSFVRMVRGDVPVEDGLSPMKPVAIEFFDSHALDLVRARRDENAMLAELPALPPEFHSAVYVEYHGENEDEIMEAMETLVNEIARSGGSDDMAWTATEDHEMRRLKDFRHAVPETVNSLIDERRKKEPELTKLGTDMAVPDDKLEAVMAMYHDALDTDGLEYVMFGHIGNNHVHVNILPRDMKDYEKGKETYLEWARHVIEMGGTVSAEHGIGKLKVALLEAMYGSKGIEEMRTVKRAFDPEFRLNRGNLFDQ